MKKPTALISAFALLFLCACSQAEGTPSQSTSQPPAASQAVSDEPVRDTGTPSAPADETDTPAPSQGLSTEEMKAIAIELSERRAPVSELYAAIGQPISTPDYAPGCIEPDSEDGELHYDGFVVYTVRTATQEYVYDVL